MQEGISIYGYLGTSGHGAGISATQYTQNGEVRNTLGVVEDRDGCSLFVFSAVAGTCHLFGIVIHLSIIVAIFSFHIHRHIGIGYGGVFTISSTEYREVRVVVVVIRILPFFCIQKVEWSHTLQYLYYGCAAYVAGKITATIDIMRVEEMLLSAFIVFCGLSIEVFSVILILCFLWMPDDEIILFCIPDLIPDDIDGETVFWLSVIAFFLFAEVVCQVYVGTACNIGIGELRRVVEGFSILICDITLSTTENLSGKVSGIDDDIGAALYLCQVAAAIDIAIDFRCS